MIFQQWLAWLFNSDWHDSSTVAGTIIQQSLARLFNSHWHSCPTVTGTIAQQLLARLFNSPWHDCSTVTGRIVQQSLAQLRFLQQSRLRLFLFSMLAEFFNSNVHCWRIMSYTRNTTHDTFSCKKLYLIFQNKYF